MDVHIFQVNTTTRGTLDLLPVIRSAPGRLDNALRWIEQHRHQHLDACLQIRDFGAAEDCIALERAIKASVKLRIVSLVLSTKTMQLLLDPQTNTNQIGNFLHHWRLKHLQHLRILPAPGSQFNQPEDLDIAASWLAKFNFLSHLEMGPFGNACFSQQCIQNFAQALESQYSLRSVNFREHNVEVWNPRLSSPILDALGTHPHLSFLDLGMWIPPFAVQTPDFQAKLLQLMKGLRCLGFSHKKLPDVLEAIQYSPGLQTLAVYFPALYSVQYCDPLGDLVCNLRKATRLQRLRLTGTFDDGNNERQMLCFIEKLGESSKIKKLELRLYKSAKIAKASRSMLVQNLTLLSVQFKFYRSKKMQDATNSLLIELCMKRNKLLKALVEDPKPCFQQSLDFLVEHNKHINTTFFFLSKKPSLLRYKALVEDPQANIEQCVSFLIECKNEVNTTFCFLSKKPSIIACCPTAKMASLTAQMAALSS